MCASRLYGIGKGASLKKFLLNNHFYQQAKVFDDDCATQNNIVAAGEKALVCLYNESQRMG